MTDTPPVVMQRRNKGTNDSIFNGGTKPNCHACEGKGYCQWPDGFTIICPACGGKAVQKPKFVHDCDQCTYLGYIPVQRLIPYADAEWYHDGVDIYQCQFEMDSGAVYSTVIIRYSSEGPDYTSGPFDGGLWDVARKMATDRGLEVPKVYKVGW